MHHFIHIPKNGGMSIRHAIKERKFPISTSTPDKLQRKYLKEMRATMKQYGEHAGTEHARWRDLTPQAQQTPAFAIIRNPWSRVVSRYTFQQNVVKLGKGTKHDKIQSFEQFLEERHIWKDKPFYFSRAIRNWYNQIDHITNVNGKIKCHLLRLENLEQDFFDYFGFHLNMHKRNVSNPNKYYTEYYNNTTKQIVADWYKEDIKTFGYTFS